MPAEPQTQHPPREPLSRPGEEELSSVALDALVQRVNRPRTGGAPDRSPRALAAAVRAWVEAATTRVLSGTVPPLVAVLALVVAASVGFLGWRFLARPAPIEQRMPLAAEVGDPAGETADAPESTVAAGGGEGPAELLTVHVAGAVRSPGLRELPAGSRVADAVAAAGGMTEEADGDRLNLAAALADGTRVYIPAVGQEVPAEASVLAGGAGRGEGAAPVQPVDINTADAEALESLPGVGPATASAILEHRERNGPFSSVESLLEVRGIGEAKLEALTDLVRVG